MCVYFKPLVNDWQIINIHSITHSFIKKKNLTGAGYCSRHWWYQEQRVNSKGGEMDIEHEKLLMLYCYEEIHDVDKR